MDSYCVLSRKFCVWNVAYCLRYTWVRRPQPHMCTCSLLARIRAKAALENQQRHTRRFGISSRNSMLVRHLEQLQRFIIFHLRLRPPRGPRHGPMQSCGIGVIIRHQRYQVLPPHPHSCSCGLICPRLYEADMKALVQNVAWCDWVPPNYNTLLQVVALSIF